MKKRNEYRIVGGMFACIFFVVLGLLFLLFAHEYLWLTICPLALAIISTWFIADGVDSENEIDEHRVKVDEVLSRIAERSWAFERRVEQLEKELEKAKESQSIIVYY